MSANLFISSTIISKTARLPTRIYSLSAPNYPNSSSISTQPIADINEKGENFKSTGSILAARTAPWMRGPFVLEPNQIVDFSRRKNKKKSSDDKDEKCENLLTHKIRGGRGKKAMKKIFQGIDKLGQENQEELEDAQKDNGKIEFELSLGRLVVDGGGEKRSYDSGRMPWEKEEIMVFRRMKKEKVVTAAELNLDGELLERLRGAARKMRKWVKVKKAGVNESVIHQIRLIWRTNELAMLKFDLPLCRNMDRAREIVEIKTGGLVVWGRKDALVVYRGCSYTSLSKVHPGLGGGRNFSYSKIGYHETSVSQEKSNNGFIDRMAGEEENVPVKGSLYEREGDRLLEGLGPRFVDWWMPKPLPVDADLLPEVVPGYKTPLRLCPMNAGSKLTDRELTYLRKLAHPLPTHFVVGRNKNLQGLAAAILKLWEKCHIAKIAVKWGIPNTNNELMATELKLLTGGVLLLRNKYFIILYRGKDFLPPGVAKEVVAREMELKSFQLQEEAARTNAIETFYHADEAAADLSTVGTLKEFQVIQSEYGGLETGSRAVEVQLEAENLKLEKELKNQERKLFILNKKIKRVSKELAKLDSAWIPAEQNEDREIITKEERECFRKIALKMDSTLLLGRRGVFDGVIEAVHQHWKHRELVKVITMQNVFSKILFTAQCLVAESGGILVSIEKLKHGHGIIIYRGKNYKRPLKLLPRNLLSKREALRRSLEMQRLGSLKFFASIRRQEIHDLKHKLAQLQINRSRSMTTTQACEG